MIHRLFYLALPQSFMSYSYKCMVYLWVLALALVGFGAYLSVTSYSVEVLNNAVFQIYFLHYLCTALSLMVYAVMIIMAIFCLILRDTITSIALHTSIRIGLLLCSLGLLAGAIDLKLILGIWWAWNVHLGFMGMVLASYLSLIALEMAMPDHQVRYRKLSILVLLGAMNLPFAYLALEWKEYLHPNQAVQNLYLLMDNLMMSKSVVFILSGLMAYFLIALLVRIRSELR